MLEYFAEKAVLFVLSNRVNLCVRWMSVLFFRAATTTCSSKYVSENSGISLDTSQCCWFIVSFPCVRRLSHQSNRFLCSDAVSASSGESLPNGCFRLWVCVGKVGDLAVFKSQILSSKPITDGRKIFRSRKPLRCSNFEVEPSLVVNKSESRNLLESMSAQWR